MSYMRGDFYTWVGESEDGEYIQIHGLCSLDADVDAGFVAITMPLPTFDELVVMRHAELLAEGIAEETETRAMKNWGGNVGCWDLRRAHGESPGFVFTQPLDGDAGSGVGSRP